jgi:hypothetical protein
MHFQLYIREDSELIINQVMGESNYRDSRMAAYRQEVRRLEEKFDGFELHHIPRRDNEATDALTRLGLSCEPPPPGVFTHDLLKLSIRLEEDILVHSPGTSLDEGSSVPAPGTPPGENGLVLVSKASPEASARPIEPKLRARGGSSSRCQTT